jgi:hypothetical protein
MYAPVAPNEGKSTTDVLVVVIRVKRASTPPDIVVVAATIIVAKAMQPPKRSFTKTSLNDGLAGARSLSLRVTHRAAYPGRDAPDLTNDLRLALSERVTILSDPPFDLLRKLSKSCEFVNLQVPWA